MTHMVAATVVLNRKSKYPTCSHVRGGPGTPLEKAILAHLLRCQHLKG